MPFGNGSGDISSDIDKTDDKNQDIFSESNKKYVENIAKIYSTDFNKSLGRDYQITVEPDGYISIHDVRTLKEELNKVQDKYPGFKFIIRATLL